MLNEKKADELVELSKMFFFDPLKKSIENKVQPRVLLDDLQRKLIILQTLMFSFMVTVRKEEAIASVYGDMKIMSMECLDNLLKNPEILNRFAALGGGEKPQSIDDTIELFKSLNQAMNKGS